MSVAALIRNGVVVNVAAYDSVLSAHWLEVITPDYDAVHIADEAGIGWGWDGQTLVPPAVEDDEESS